LSFADADADARTTAILAAGLALSCRGWNDDAGFLSPATDDSGAATADRDAVAMATAGEGLVDEREIRGAGEMACVGMDMVGPEKVKVAWVDREDVPGQRWSPDVGCCGRAIAG
jgi:hypothetical protein